MVRLVDATEEVADVLTIPPGTNEASVALALSGVSCTFAVRYAEPSTAGPEHVGAEWWGADDTWFRHTIACTGSDGATAERAIDDGTPAGLVLDGVVARSECTDRRAVLVDH